jgi:hypothetical protein
MYFKYVFRIQQSICAYDKGGVITARPRFYSYINVY